jgi:hypothetical protein
MARPRHHKEEVMNVHILKTDPAAYDAVASGAKTHEIRFNVLVLRKTMLTGNAMRDTGHLPVYVGEPLRRVVTHIQTGYGLGPGWVIMSTRPQIDEDFARARRYEFVRTLSPRAFLALWSANIRGEGSFDSLVDAAILSEAILRTCAPTGE